MENLSTGNDQLIAILNKGGNGENNQILTIINASTDPQTVTLPEGKWAIYVSALKAGTEVQGYAENELTIRGTAVMILVQTASFEDVPVDSFYAEAVEWAVAEGITNGVTANTFVPARDVTRAEVVTFLWRANGEPVVESDKSFPDVSKGDFFYNAVIWAAEEGITTGKDNGLFDPYATCTRAEALTFLWRAAGQPESNVTENFDDVNDSDFFAPAVKWAVENKITDGIDADSFGSYNVCNRAHIITFLFRSK